MTETAALRAEQPRIGVLLGPTRDGGDLLADARAFEAAGVDSLWFDVRDGDPYVALAAIAAVTSRVRLVAVGAGDGAGRATCAVFARGRLVDAEELAASGERWEVTAHPPGRARWRVVRASAARDGVTGVVLRNDPRLLDLLRNPDVDDDRSDLNIAVG